jgi:predicted transcriptional regulator
MKDFINNFFQASNERLKNPLIFSFLISWVAFNWRPLFTLILSEQKIEERINYITTNFNETQFTLYYPLFVSLGYVVLLPYFTWIIEKIVQFAKSGRKENLINEQIYDLKGKQKIAKEERNYEEEKAGNVEISELNNKILELSKKNEERQKEIESLKIDYNNLKKEKNKLEQYINLESPDEVEFSEAIKVKLDQEYEDFLKTEVSTYFEKIGTEISQFKSIPKNTEAIIIEKLIYSGLISKVDDDENQRTYYLLTKKGKYFWKNYVLSKNIMTQQEWESQDSLPF